MSSKNHGNPLVQIKMATISNKGKSVFSPVKVRSCANERERGRTQSVNGAFLNLR